MYTSNNLLNLNGFYILKWLRSRKVNQSDSIAVLHWWLNGNGFYDWKSVYQQIIIQSKNNKSPKSKT